MTHFFTLQHLSPAPRLVRPSPPLSSRTGWLWPIVVLFLLFCRPLPVPAATDYPLQQTIDTFRLVHCLHPDDFASHKEVIMGLSYTNMRLFRAFCRMKTILPDEAIATLEKLLFREVRYDHVLLFERFALLPGADHNSGWQLLDRLQTVNFPTIRALTALHREARLSGNDFFRLMDTLSPLPESGQWAAQSFLALPALQHEDIIKGLSLIGTMTEEQQWATEKLCALDGLTPVTAFAVMEQLATMSAGNAWHVRTLCSQQLIHPDDVRHWVDHYFALPRSRQEKAFSRLTAPQKSLLLQVMDGAADHHIHRINNLHSVTDAYGREISYGALMRSTQQQLERLFSKLPAASRTRYAPRFTQALHQGDQQQSVDTLLTATHHGRRQAAAELSTANIYILMSRGSELFDSSFRDILVVRLLERLRQQKLTLLPFLLAMDPENNHVSDFIISLAQKGKLTTFFPRGAKEQQEVIDLVAQSAFQHEQSLILFSATFTKLLQAITPETRSYLISTMLSAIRSGQTIFTRQLQVILQYYLQEYPQLLATADLTKIQTLLADIGHIDLSRYTTTDFGEWKRDKRLQSLSIFQQDDDGRSSYASNYRTLINSGYRPQLSTSFRLGSVTAEDTATISRVLRSKSVLQGKNFFGLFRLQTKYSILIDWVKTVNDITIVHSVHVYQGKSQQQNLLRQFIVGGSEMFAQRGHSYWRQEQILDPMEYLVKTGQVSQADILAKQRLLSIGSCGGIRVYTRLNKLFQHNIDIMATVGTGKSAINNPYNQQLLEIIAANPDKLSWKQIALQASPIFAHEVVDDYLQPGSLPAILHKIMDRTPHQ